MKKLPKPKKPKGYKEKKAVKEIKFKAKPPKKSGLMPGFMKDPSDLETVRESLGLKKKPEGLKKLREVLEPPKESDPLETYADDILAMEDFEIPKLKSEKTLMDKTISQISIKKELLKLRREKRQLQEEQQQIKEILVKTTERKSKPVISDVYNEVKKTLNKLKSKSEKLKEKERILFHKFKKLMLAGKTIEQANLSINERFAKIRELQEQVESHEVKIESVTSFNSLNAFIKDIDFYLTAVKNRKSKLKINSEFIEKEQQFHRFLKNRIINKKSLNASLTREVQGLEKVEIYNLIDETFTLLRKEQIEDARNNYKLIRKKYSESNIKNPEIYDSIYSLYETITS